MQNKEIASCQDDNTDNLENDSRISSQSNASNSLSSPNNTSKKNIAIEILQCKNCRSSKKLLCISHENDEKELIDHLISCSQTFNETQATQEWILLLNKDHQAIHFKISTKIRFLSRKFELPRSLLPSILHDLKDPSIGLNIKINLAQALKYGVRKNLDIENEELLELLEEDSAEIKSEILWALGFKVKNSATGLTNELLERINTKINQDMAPEAKAFLRSQIAKHEHLNTNDALKRSLEKKLLGDQVQFLINHYKLSVTVDDLSDHGWSFEQIIKVFQKVESRTVLQEKIREPLLQVLESLVHYKIPATIGNIFEVLGDNVEEWVNKINEIATEMHCQANPQVQNSEELISELKSMNIDNPSVQNLIEKGLGKYLVLIKDQELKSRIDFQYHADKVLSTLPFEIRTSTKLECPISEWTKAEISVWAKIVKSIPSSLNNAEFFCEALAVIKRANFLETGFCLTDAQIISCIIQLNANPAKGWLMQVGTGEGKSTIVSVLAIIHALQGKKVDIITSSPVLAERDAREKAGLYKMFGLSCMDNGDKSLYIKGPKSCYRHDIVYGEIAQFQFDTLRDKYSLLGTLAGRECEVAIIDEVDCMLIDDSSNIARLSSPIAGMDLLQPFMHFLWQRLCLLLQQFIRVEIEGNIMIFLKEQLEYYLQEDLIKGGRIPVPKNFKEFVENQISQWIDNAIRALMSQEDQEYVIQDGVVNPVVYDSTGVVQRATSWSGGLHQLIQRKHGLKMTSETCTTNFLSNIGYIKKYGSNLFGLTGTLGSKKAKQVLSEVYDVDLVQIPLLRKKQYLEYRTMICSDHDRWLKGICDSAIYEAKRGRGALIICQTIEHCKLIGNELAKRYRKGVIKLYTMNNMDQERDIEKMNPGEIIVATNLAGRGTDIKTDNIEKNGGLHVIVTFLPPNQRVEDQAFGRTARQGKRGTGQMILNRTMLLEYEDALPKEIKGLRDDLESKMFDEFMEKKLLMANTKDELFARFCKLKYEICENVRACMGLWEKVKSFRSSSVYETNMLKALEERWALFLHKIENEIIPLDSTKEYNSFEKGVFEDFEKDQLVKNPYYHIKIANDLLINNSISESQKAQVLKNLEEAIKLDPEQSAVAFVGRALFEIKTKKKESLQKSRIMNDLIESLKLLSNEMSLLNYFQAVLQQEGFDIQCGLSKQLIDKIMILGSYMNSIQNALTVIKKSQRLIDVTGRNEKIISNFYDLERDEKMKEVLQEFGKHDQFTVMFNDLTKLDESNDDKDQAIKTIRNALAVVQPPSSDSSDSNKLKNLFNMTKNKTKGLFKGYSTLDPSIYKDFAIILNELNHQGIKGLFDPDLQIVNVNKDVALAKLKENEWKCCEVDLKSELNGKPEKSRTKSKLKEAMEIIKKSNNEKETFSIIFRDLNKTAKTVKKEILHSSVLTLEYTNLNYKIAKNRLQRIKCKSLHLEISGIKEEISKALITSGVQNVQLLADPGNNDVIEVLEVHEARERINRMKDNQICAKIEDLSKEAAERILNICSKASFNLTFTGVVDTIILLQDLGEVEFVNLSFTKLSSAVAIQLVHILRKSSFDFTLGLSNLSAEQLKEIIRNASLEQEDIEITQVKKLSDLFPENTRPNLELAEFAARGIEHIFEINEKRFIPWRSVMTVAAVGSLQVALGGLLITTGFGASSGMGLVTEGASDYITAYRAYRRRHFMWSDYAKQKAVSLAISAVSLGAGRLKDGFKGMNTVLSGIEREAIEQAGTQVLVNSQTLKTALIQTGKSLQKLSMHQVALTTSEVVIREGLNNMTGSFVNLTLEKVKPQVSSIIQKKVETKFSEEGSLRILIQKMYALDKIRNSEALSNQINKIAQDIISPERSRNRDMWDSIGMPLCQGVLSGNNLSLNLNILRTLSGLTQISLLIDKFHSEFIKKLSEIDNKESLSIHCVLHQHCKISLEEARDISEILKAKGVILKNLYCEYINVEQEKLWEIDFGKQEKYKNIVLKFCEDLHKYSLTNNINRIMRLTSDIITDKIIRVTESHLISPWSACAVGEFTSNISANIQNSLIHNQLKNDSFLLSKRFKKKIRRELRNENKLTTISGLISHQAKRHTSFYTQCENIYYTEQRKLNAQTGNPMPKLPNKKGSQDQREQSQAAQRKEWIYSFKGIAGTVIKVTVKITQAGEIILKQSGAEADPRLSSILTAAKIVRITAIGVDMANDIILSAFEKEILSGEFLLDILHQIERNKLTIYEAALCLKLRCFEGVFSELKELGVPAQKLRTIYDVIKICQQLKDGKTDLLKIILDIDTKQIFKKKEWKRYFRDTLGIVKKVSARIIKAMKFIRKANGALSSLLKAINLTRRTAINFGQIFELINSGLQNGILSPEFLTSVLHQIAKIDFSKLETPASLKSRRIERVFLRFKKLKVPSQKLMRIKKIMKAYQRVKNKRGNLVRAIFDCFAQEFQDPKILAQIYQFFSKENEDQANREKDGDFIKIQKDV